MSPEELIADPLYQINLCLWMLIPSKGAGVVPLLRNVGFWLRALEQQIPLPIQIRDALAKREVRISDPVVPDLILEHSDRSFVLLECKASMFGSEVTGGDSPHRQARALLIQVPEFLASSLGLERTTVGACHITYLSRHVSKISPTRGVSELAKELAKHGLRTVPFGMLGMRVDRKGIRVVGGYKPGHLPGQLSAKIPPAGAVVQRIEPNTDPRPLYFIPWMPGSEHTNDLKAAEAFGNRILQVTAARIGQSRPPVTLSFSIDEILNEATSNCFDRWKNRDSAKQLRKKAKRLLMDTCKESGLIGAIAFPEPGAVGTVTLQVLDGESKGKLIEGFRKWEPSLWTKLDPQGDLFEGLG